MRQYKLVNVTVNPVLYNPVTKKLKMITGGELTIYDSPEPTSKSMKPATGGIQPFSKKIQSLAVNFSDAAASYGLPNLPQRMGPAAAPLTGEVYAIITTSSIASQALLNRDDTLQVVSLIVLSLRIIEEKEISFATCK